LTAHSLILIFEHFLIQKGVSLVSQERVSWPWMLLLWLFASLLQRSFRFHPFLCIQWRLGQSLHSPEERKGRQFLFPYLRSTLASLTSIAGVNISFLPVVNTRKFFGDQIKKDDKTDLAFASGKEKKE
jgi:hypothetical protein